MAEQQTTVTLTVAELEALIRRVVREELTRLARQQPSILDDWSHEGPDDPEGDEALLNEVLGQIEREKTTPAVRIPWDEAQAELDQQHDTESSHYRTPLGRKLAAIRSKIVESGEPVLSWEEIEQEVARRRGGSLHAERPDAQ